MNGLYAVVITGDRNGKSATWEPVISEFFRGLQDRAKQVVVLHGDCRGIDRLAGRLAKVHIPDAAVIPMPFVEAKGNAGGPIRNTAMLVALKQFEIVGYWVGCVGFHDFLPKSKGTKDCTEQSVAMGIRTVLYASNGLRKRL